MAWAAVALFLTGAGGLLLELVWARALGWALGLSVGTQALAVAAFVGGNGAGAALAGRWVAKRGGILKAARLLAGLTLLVSLGVYPLLAWAGRPEAPAWLRGAGPALFPVFLAALAGGGVTPLVVSSLAGEGQAGRAGFLLGWNLLGSLAGALVGGAWLIPSLGCRLSGWIGACGYGLAGLLLLPARPGRASPAREEKARPGREDLASMDVRALLPGAFLAGFAALGLETLLFRMLVLRTGAFSLSLAGVAGAFLLALGLGSFFLPPLLGRSAPGAAVPWTLLLGLLGALAAPHLFNLSGTLLPWHRGGSSWVQAGLPLLYGLFVGGPAALALGAAFPLFYAAAKGARPLVAGTLTLAWSAGALAGAALTPLVLIPLAPGPDPFPWTGWILGGLLLFSLPSLRPGKGAWAAGGLGAAALLLGVFPAGRAAKTPPFLRTPAATPGRKVWATLHDAVTVATAVYDYRTHEKLLFTGGFQAASLGREGGYMRLLAHLPLLLHPSPRRVVLVALGTGTTLQSLCLHKELDRIDAVEISPAVVGLTRWFPGPGSSPPDPGLSFSFRGADSRVRLHVQDGRLYLRDLAARRIRGLSPGADVITQEPLLPYTPAALPFYTLEFYRIVRDALAPGGVFAQWIPLGSTPPGMSKVLASTMARAFPRVSLWVFNNSALLMGSLVERSPSPARFRRAFLEEGVAEDLRRAGAARAEDLLAGFVTAERKTLLGGEVLRDDRPFLERFARPSGGEILDWLPRALQWVGELKGKEPPPFVSRRLFTAWWIHLEGRILQAGERRAFLLGGRLEPPRGGKGFLRALGADPLYRPAWLDLRAYWAEREALAGRAALARGDFPGAAAHLRASLQWNPAGAWVRVLLASAQSGMGERGRAWASLKEAAWWWPGLPSDPFFRRALRGRLLAPLARNLGKRLTLLEEGTGRPGMGPFRPKEQVLFGGIGAKRLAELACSFPLDFTGALLAGLKAGGKARKRALQAAALLGDPFLAREVAREIGTYSSRERALAVPLLAGTAFPAGPLLEKLARDPAAEVRAALGEVLGREGKPSRALEILLGLLQDPVLEVRQAAALSVKVRLGDLRGYDPAGREEERGAALERLRVLALREGARAGKVPAPEGSTERGGKGGKKR